MRPEDQHSKRALLVIDRLASYLHPPPLAVFNLCLVVIGRAIARWWLNYEIIENGINKQFSFPLLCTYFHRYWSVQPLCAQLITIIIIITLQTATIIVIVVLLRSLLLLILRRCCHLPLQYYYNNTWFPSGPLKIRLKKICVFCLSNRFWHSNFVLSTMCGVR